MSPDSIRLLLYQGDASVDGLGLWLDPHRARDFAFVSRAHSDHTFAVRDEESGALRVIGKAYSGLTDAEIDTLAYARRLAGL